MNANLRRPVLLCAAALALAGCGSSPDGETRTTAPATPSATAPVTTVTTPTTGGSVPGGQGDGGQGDAPMTTGGGGGGAGGAQPGGEFDGPGPSQTARGGNLVTPPSVGGSGLPSQNPGDGDGDGGAGSGGD